MDPPILYVREWVNFDGLEAPEVTYQLTTKIYLSICAMFLLNAAQSQVVSLNHVSFDQSHYGVHLADTIRFISLTDKVAKVESAPTTHLDHVELNDESSLKGPLARVIQLAKVAAGIKDTAVKSEYLMSFEIDDTLFERLQIKGVQWADTKFFTCVSWELKSDSDWVNKVMALKTSAYDAIRIYLDNRLIFSEGEADSITGSVESCFNSKGTTIPIVFSDTGSHLLSVRYIDNNFFAEAGVIMIGEFFRCDLFESATSALAGENKEQRFFSYVSMEYGLAYFFYCCSILAVLFLVFITRSAPMIWFCVFSLSFSLALSRDFVRLSSIQDFYLALLSGISCVMYFYSAYQKIPRRIYAYIFFLIVPIVIGISMNQSMVMSMIQPLVWTFILSTVVIIVDFLITWIKNFRKRITGVNIAASGVFVFLLVAVVSIGVKLMGWEFETPEYVSLASRFYLPVSFVISIMQITRAYYQDKEKSQRDVIDLTKQNNEILQNQNRYLESEVAQRTAELQTEKKLVEIRNTEILDSIEYARRIQNTILPPNEWLSSQLRDSFVLYLPKDIVAGDFYWIHKLHLKSGVLAAVCDCTGHGVPGAMVSVVCSNALNKAVNELSLTRPSDILDATREEVIVALSKNNLYDDEVKDGMDASLALIHFETRVLYWAGANNPIWIVRGQNLIEIIGDKQPVGKSPVNKPFTHQEVKLEQGDCLYLFTDGYQDQFGGERNRKFSKKQLRDLILSLSSLPMNEQLERLKQQFFAWKGDQEQIDDICIMGIRIP